MTTGKNVQLVFKDISRRRFKRIWFMVVGAYNESDHRNAFTKGASIETLWYHVNNYWRLNYAKVDRSYWFTVSELKAVLRVAEKLGMVTAVRELNKCTIYIPMYLRAEIVCIPDSCDIRAIVPYVYVVTNDPAMYETRETVDG